MPVLLIGQLVMNRLPIVIVVAQLNLIKLGILTAKLYRIQHCLCLAEAFDLCLTQQVM